MTDTTTPRLTDPGNCMYWHGTVGIFSREAYSIPELYFCTVARPGRDCEVRLCPRLIPLIVSALTRSRLDAMHNGIKNYFDGKLFLAPLDDPRTILDIGYAYTIPTTSLLILTRPLPFQVWLRNLVLNFISMSNTHNGIS